MKAIHAVFVASTALAVAGCTTVDPTHSFGKAATAVAAAQTANPAAGAAAKPVVEGGDSEVVKSAVDTLRIESVPKEARQAPR